MKSDFSNFRRFILLSGQFYVGVEGFWYIIPKIGILLRLFTNIVIIVRSETFTTADTHFSWNELFVPRWSRSWHKQPTNIPKTSRSEKVFFMSQPCWKATTFIILNIDCTPRFLGFRSYHHNGEHDLGDVESVSPIVIRHVSVVAFDRDKESVQCLKWRKTNIISLIPLYLNKFQLFVDIDKRNLTIRLSLRVRLNKLEILILTNNCWWFFFLYNFPPSKWMTIKYNIRL